MRHQLEVRPLRSLVPFFFGALLAGCVTPQAAAPNVTPTVGAPAKSAPVTFASTPLSGAAPCTGAFVAHDLDHTTQAPGPATRLFDSNGSGLAVNDLDGDGDDDIVLANLAGPATILWNQGGLHFERQKLDMLHRARGVASVDVAAVFAAVERSAAA